MTNSDEHIVHLLGTGDPGAMRMVFKRYYHRLCAYAMRYPLSYDDAEDVVQSVMISFWSNKNSADFRGSLSAYLFGAVSKCALKRLRDDRHPYFIRIESSSDKLADDAVSATEESIHQMREKIAAHIGGLPEQQRRIVKEIAISNVPYKEVASKLGISVNTVKTHYARALRQLRSKINV